MAQQTAHVPGAGDDHAHDHPSEAVYIKIAVILVAITAIEVVIWYVDWFHRTHTLVPALVVLSIIKFATVVGYYMHLKFDDPRFRYLFMAGLILSASIVAALVMLLRTHKIEYLMRMIGGAN